MKERDARGGPPVVSMVKYRLFSERLDGHHLVKIPGLYADPCNHFEFVHKKNSLLRTLVANTALNNMG